MQTLSELVYQQDAKMGETEHATLTDSSSADEPSQPTSPALEPKNSGTLPILEVGKAAYKHLKRVSCPQSAQEPLEVVSPPPV